MNLKTIILKEKYFLLVLISALIYEIYYVVSLNLPLNVTNISISLSSFSIVICLIFALISANVFRLTTATVFIGTFLLALIAAKVTSNMRVELFINMIVGVIVSVIGASYILFHIFYKTTKHTIKKVRST